MLDAHNHLVKKWVKTCILGRLWSAGGQGSGWGQAEARPEVRQERGRDATGQEGRCCCGSEQTAQGARLLSPEPTETKRKQDLGSQPWQE